jgi:HlyD family secretion protein
LARSTIVAAPASGRLIEWKASFGSYVGPGSTVASVLSGARTLQFVLYIPPSDGKRVKVGMPALIELDGVHKEDWGSLVGRVSSVSEFPSTPEGMHAVLQNDALVRTFSGQGAPFLARVDLIPDPRSPTGYKWSGGRGPPGALGSGATGTGRVVVQEQRPIAYVLGFLRKASGA